MGLDSNKDLEIKKKVWENLAHFLTELTVQDIADIMNKMASLSRIDMSGSCTWCGDFVKKRRYKAGFHIINADKRGRIRADNYPISTKFYMTYDVQIIDQNLTVFNVVSAGLKMHAHHQNDKVSYVSYLILLQNNTELERVYFEVSKDKIRVINGISGRAGEPTTYLGEVNLNLPDPNSLNEDDKITIKLVTTMDLQVGGGKGGVITSEENFEIRHEEVGYVEQR